MLSQKKWVTSKQRSSRIFGKAYMKAATAEIAYSGFKKSGIFPFNRHIFRDSDFGIHNQEAVHPTQQDVVEEKFLSELYQVATETGKILKKMTSLQLE
jgi:hypothetical protein